MVEWYRQGKLICPALWKSCQRSHQVAKRKGQTKEMMNLSHEVSH
jgi:hypothetical protein